MTTKDFYLIASPPLGTFKISFCRSVYSNTFPSKRHLSSFKPKKCYITYIYNSKSFIFVTNIYIYKIHLPVPCLAEIVIPLKFSILSTRSHLFPTVNSLPIISLVPNSDPKSCKVVKTVSRLYSIPELAKSSTCRTKS